MSRYKNPNYHNEWYHKNKERLLADPKKRQRKRELQRKDYIKHKEKRLASQKEYVKRNKEKIKKRNHIKYLKTKNALLPLRKEQRQTPEYKAYVKAYRLKNRDKINGQQKVTAERSIRKMIDSITDSYLVGQILHSPLNKLSRKELYANKELLEIKRGQILVTRLKRKINSLKK